MSDAAPMRGDAVLGRSPMLRPPSEVSLGSPPSDTRTAFLFHSFLKFFLRVAYTMGMAYKVKVAVLRGGPSSEYDVSLKSGATVLRHLPEEYEPHDVFIDRTGNWHHRGIEVDPADLPARFDVAFNALHGEYGEDGKIQRILDTLGMRYTGSKALASALAMNKAQTKDILKSHGILMPMHAVVVKGDDIDRKALELWRTFPQPLVVKPAGLGSSVGVSIAKTFNELVYSLKRILEYTPAAVVEEYVSGREATVGVVDLMHDKDVHALPPVEIRIPPTSELFDYEAKYGGGTEEICPGTFSSEETRELQEMSEYIHRTLDLRHYSRSDFIIHPRRGIFFLETNTLPGLTEHSLLPKALRAEGVELSDFLRHVIEMARHK